MNAICLNTILTVTGKKKGEMLALGRNELKRFFFFFEKGQKKNNLSNLWHHNLIALQ